MLALLGPKQCSFALIAPFYRNHIRGLKKLAELFPILADVPFRSSAGRSRSKTLIFEEMSTIMDTQPIHISVPDVFTASSVDASRNDTDTIEINWLDKIIGLLSTFDSSRIGKLSVIRNRLGLTSKELNLNVGTYRDQCRALRKADYISSPILHWKPWERRISGVTKF